MFRTSQFLRLHKKKVFPYSDELFAAIKERGCKLVRAPSFFRSGAVVKELRDVYERRADHLAENYSSEHA